MHTIRKIIAFFAQIGPAYRAGQAEQARQLAVGRWLHENAVDPVTEYDRICLCMYQNRRDGI